jgi:hypothetical protein
MVMPSMLGTAPVTPTDQEVEPAPSTDGCLQLTMVIVARRASIVRSVLDLPGPRRRRVAGWE